MYITYYRFIYDNELNQRVEIEVKKKDGDPDRVAQEYAVTSVQINAVSPNNKPDDWIVSKELIVSFDIRDVDLDYWDDLVNAAHDDWRVDAMVDDHYFFNGFVFPDEGKSPLHDRPYDATIRATDGLGLLKQVPLKNYQGNDFVGITRLIDIVAGALTQTKLGLQIKVYDDVYENSFFRRDTNLKWDMWSQTKIHARTFETDPGKFTDCFSALEKLLSETHKIFQHDATFLIIRRRLIQYRPYLNYYTLYSPDAAGAVGFEDTSNYVEVGRDNLIYPWEDVMKSATFAVKSVKTQYSYDFPVNLIANQKIQSLGSFIAPLSGIGYAAWQLVGWAQYHKYVAGPNGPSTPINNKLAYIRTETNPYGFETARYFVLPFDPASQNGPQTRNYLLNLNNDAYVEAGDKLSISVDWRVRDHQTGPYQIFFMQVLLLRMGGNPAVMNDWYSLDSTGKWSNSGDVDSIAGFYQGSGDITQWQSGGPEDSTAPVSGSIFITLGSGGVANTNEIHFKGLNITYTGFQTADPNNPLKGDYWERSQNAVYLDKIESEVYISDSSRRAAKGALFRADGINLTGQWYRFGLTENRQYKEITNLEQFNSSYRRYYKIEGTFTSLQYEAENNRGVLFPLSFHQRYYFVQLDKYFALVPPLKLDLITGNFSGNFQEVSGPDFPNDGHQEGDSYSLNYIF